MKKSNLFLVVLCLTSLYLFLSDSFFSHIPAPSFFSSAPDIEREPIQNDLSLDERSSFTHLERKYRFHIKTIAEYEIRARVVSKKKYSRGWEALLMPIDLALSWGKLAKDHYHKKMKYKHSHRYYSWWATKDIGISRNYIISHSANVHLIPATHKIKKALMSIRIDDHILISGYLVNAYGPKGEESRSSLTRRDTGSGACENIYVQKIQIGEKVYAINDK